MILDIPNQTTAFVQNAADSVDHNKRTLDDPDSWYILWHVDDCRRHPWNSIKPANSYRVYVASLDVAIVGRVQIRYHREECRGMAAVTHQKFVNP